MSRRLNRRQFVQASAVTATAAGYWLTGGVTESFARQNNPMNKLNIAFIGAGGRAEGNISGCTDENIVALCDVDSNRARTMFNRFANATKYSDWRVMLEKQKDIEAVVVSTPDHSHAIASITAMRMGKHCYTEKPLTHSVWEARQMAEVARAQRVATQMGNQGTSHDGFRSAVETIRAGAIGDIREVHVWTNRPGTYWRQGHRERPQDRPAVPPHINWDVWLGPAPERPYHPNYHPFAWRGWWDFGTGALGDMACHTMNMAFMALRLGAPSSVTAQCDQEINAESPPNGLIVTYEFPARGNLPACTLKWYEVRRPPMELLHGEAMVGSGSLFVGAKGKIYSPDDYGARIVFLPRDQFPNQRAPAPTLPRVGGRHHQEWIRACKGGPAAMSNFVDHAGPLTETVLLGNVAIRTGRRIVWDSAKLQAIDVPAAAPFLRREYRKGWTI